MLEWPLESANRAEDEYRWSHAGSNNVLDFHGDPVRSRLTVFSDGNHHMALADTLATFVADHPEVNDVFYATTPPAILINAVQHGGVRLGNLFLARRPQLFIGPRDVIEKLNGEGYFRAVKPFMASRGNVLLVQKGNPRGIKGLSDLLRPDVRLFVSNPVTERASYFVYSQTILELARQQGLPVIELERILQPEHSNTLFGERIHHREAPEALASDRAQVAMVYYHLALRYMRIFPDNFEFLSLGRAPDSPEAEGMVTTAYWVGLFGDSDEWGDRCYAFLDQDEVTEIYRYHGLARR